MSITPAVLKPGEVAGLFGVDPKTVRRWAQDGTIPGAFKTPGGQLRFRAGEVHALAEKARIGGNIK